MVEVSNFVNDSIATERPRRVSHLVRRKLSVLAAATMAMIPAIFVPLVVQALLLLCGYQSFKALESERNEDDKHWLTFWHAAAARATLSCDYSLTYTTHSCVRRLVYSMLAMAKTVTDFVSIIIPFYDEAHIGAIIWLAFLGGTNQAYAVLRPLIKEHESMIDAKLAEARKTAEAKLAEAKNAATGYAKQHLQ